MPRAYTLLDAKQRLLAICREVATKRQRAYVREKSGERFMTIAPTEHHAIGPIVDVKAVDFRHNFSRFSSLVRLGFCFRLHQRDDDLVAYIRRHTSYDDPLKAVIDTHNEAIIGSLMTRLAAGKYRPEVMRGIIAEHIAMAVNCGNGRHNADDPDEEANEGRGAYPLTVQIKRRPKATMKK